MITRHNYPVAKTLPTGWLQEGGYIFKYKDVSTRLYGTYTPESSVVWLGPPLIPFIPRFLFARKQTFGKLKLVIEIQSPAETSGLEISQIRVLAVTEKPLSIYNIQSDYLGIGLENRKHLAEFLKHPIVTNEKLKISLECDSTLKELERVTIEIGSINVGEENITLPPLGLHKKSLYYYFPFGFEFGDVPL